MPGKRLSEHDCHYSNFKRPKAFAIRQFPKHCGDLADKTNIREYEGFPNLQSAMLEYKMSPTLDEACKPLTVGGEEAVTSLKYEGFRILQSRMSEYMKSHTSDHVSIPLAIGVEAVVTSLEDEGFSNLQSSMLEFVKPPTSDLGGGVAVTSLEPSKTLASLNPSSESESGMVDENQSEMMRKIDSETSVENVVLPQEIVDMGTSFYRKCSKGQQRVVERKFPPNCGVLNHSSVSRNELRLDQGSKIESNSPIETVNNRVESSEDEDANRIRAKHDQNVGERIVYVLRGENCELVPKEASTGCTRIKDEEKDEAYIATSSSQYSFLSDNSKFQNVSKKDADHGHEDHIDVEKSNFTSFKTEDNLTTGVVFVPSVRDGSVGEEGNELTNVAQTNICVSRTDERMNQMKDPSLFAADYEECLASHHCERVREAITLYNELYNELLEKLKANPDEYRRAISQLSIQVAQILKKQQKWVNTKIEFGHVPGVRIGDSFQFRAELAAIGLHHQYVSGIDWVKIGKEKYASSIVDSGCYENETRSSDILIYTGQGGNRKIADGKTSHQKLEGPNRALMNSMREGHPVRVIRGHKFGKSKIHKSQYIYDGLYALYKCAQEKDEHGKLVYKFELHRIPGQPKLVHALGLKSKRKHRDNCLATDISQGKEKRPIRVVNEIDDEKLPPFTYMEKMIYPDWYLLSTPSGCNCTDGCSNPKLCPCAAKNGGEIPFNGKGSLINTKPIVHECGPSCQCPPSCINRVSQHGPRHSLEVFKTQSRGWGVRSRNYISSGSFICEYIGELLDDKEAEQRVNDDEYLFDIGNHLEDSKSNSFVASDCEGFSIDAKKMGNVGRFINHSCSPNLLAQNVVFDHDDLRVAHIMFFAAKNIRPLMELTYDYNYILDSVLDGNGNIKKKDCHCGSRQCTRRMY